MEQKKNERAGRGADAWQPQAQQQELDEADRFQVHFLPKSNLALPQAVSIQSLSARSSHWKCASFAMHDCLHVLLYQSCH